MNWLELSLELEGEQVEPAAELFTRHGHGAVIEAAGPSGHDQVFLRTYLNADDDGRRRLARIERGLWHLSQISPYPQLQVRTIETVDWSVAWREHYRPLDVGERLQIVPAWMEAVPGDRLMVRMDPGMAFGTGTHPSTRLSLELIETRINPNDHVIDIGCGSGILSIAAVLLGAQAAWAVDTSAEAVAAARANAEINGVGDRVHSAHGSLPALASMRRSNAFANLVIANILAPTLLQLFDEGLETLVGPRTTLILSGILEGQLDEIERAAGQGQLLRTELRQEQDWVALAYTRNPPR